jgi:hypothetical protein
MNQYLIRSTFLAFALALTACGGGGSDASPGGGSGNGGGPGNGGGSGSGGSGNDGPIDGTVIPEVSGLTGDAGYQGLLFYTEEGSETFRYNLMAIDPASNPIAPEEVMANIFVLDDDYRVYAVPQADINADRVENYHIDRLMFAKLTNSSTSKVELYTTSADAAGNWPPVPSKVPFPSSCTSFSGANFVNALQFDLAHPEDTVFSFRGGVSMGDNKQCQVSVDKNGTPQNLGENLRPISPVWDNVNQRPDGWLMLKDEGNYEIQQFDLAGNSLGNVKDENGNPVSGNSFWSQGIHSLGPVLEDGSQLIIHLKMEYSSDLGMNIIASSLVSKFEPAADSSNPGTLTPFENQNGEQLELSSHERPLARQMALVDETYYFFTKDRAGDQFLASVNKDGWARLKDIDQYSLPQALAGGQYVVWSAYHNTPTGGRTKLHSYDTVNNTTIELDEEVDSDNFSVEERLETAWTSRIYAPMLAHTEGNTGTVFYIRERSIDVQTGTINGYPVTDTKTWTESVARSTDGSGEPVIIKDARWMAASTNGKGPVRGLSSLMHVESGRAGYTKNLELGEVFFLTDDSKLAAVSASDPAAGMVVLGQLQADADDISQVGPSELGNLRELGAGPHRLLQVDYKNGKQAVFYADTSQENSLQKLTSTDDEDIEPVRGF